jgi:hypothetical protein
MHSCLLLRWVRLVAATQLNVVRRGRLSVVVTLARLAARRLKHRTQRPLRRGRKLPRLGGCD